MEINGFNKFSNMNVDSPERQSANETHLKGDKQEMAWIEEDQRKNTSCIRKLLKPFLVALAIGGCFNFCEINSAANGKRSRWNKKYILSMMYRIFCLLVTLLLISKYIVSIFFLPPDIRVSVFLSLVWTSSVTCYLLVFFKATSTRYGNMNKAMEEWDKIITEMKNLGMKIPEGTIKKRIIATLVVAVLYVCFNMAGLTFQVEMTTPNHYTFPMNGTTAAKILFLSLKTIITFTSIIALVYMVVISKCMTKFFKMFNEYFENQVLNGQDSLPENFNRMKNLHFRLCKLVEVHDKDIAWFLAANIVINLFLAIFCLYNIMKTPMDNMSMILSLFWLFTSLAFVGVDSAFAASTHEAAHAPLDTIYYINVQDITVEKLAQLNLFLSKLTGTQVGFTTCGLLTITKEFILTIAGVFLTYFAVLYTL